MHSHTNIKTNTQLIFLSTSSQTVATLKNVAKNVRLCIYCTPSAQTKNEKMDNVCITPRILSVIFNYSETRTFRKLMYRNYNAGRLDFHDKFCP